MQLLGGWHPLLPDKPLEQTTSKETNKKDKQATSKNIQKTSKKYKKQATSGRETMQPRDGCYPGRQTTQPLKQTTYM